MINTDWLESRLAMKPRGRVLHYLMYTQGFNGPRVPEDMLKPWGIYHCKMAFANHLFGQGVPATGWVNEELTKRYLADRTKLPYRSTFCIDIESDEWHVVKKDGNNLSIQPQAIEWRVKLLELVHTERPDLEVGYYSQLPVRYYEAVMGPGVEPAIHEALIPIAELADVLFPDFYFISRLGITSLTTWVNRVMGFASEHYPRKEVCPFLWPHYYDYWLESPELRNTGMHERACRMRVEVWQALLDAVYKHTPSWLLWAGDGYPPWDEMAPWWTATKQILIERGNAAFSTICG